MSAQTEQPVEQIVTDETTVADDTDPAETILVDLKEKPSQKKGKEHDRVFTLVSVKDEEGNERQLTKTKKDADGPITWKGDTPSGAARKAAHRACKELYGTKPSCKVIVMVRETTPNKTSKDYPYEGIRTFREKEVDFTGSKDQSKVSIKFKYDMKMNSLRSQMEKPEKPKKEPKKKAEKPTESSASDTPTAPAPEKVVRKKKEKVDKGEKTITPPASDKPINTKSDV
jgi:hypothetical protein